MHTIRDAIIHSCGRCLAAENGFAELCRMDQCLDQYEEQLFKVFSSHDSDNDGSLDHPGLLQLCETLQLQDKSDDLITSLLRNHHRSKATFPQFKDALLQLLGNMQNTSAKDQNHNREKDKDRDICNAIEKESPDKEREVAPKYVVGSKKYGRRSRPRIDESPIGINSLHTSNGIQRSNSTADHVRPQVKPSRLQRCTSVPSVTSYDETSFISNISTSSMTDGCTEEMLREAWRKLGVGEDGYLNQKELILVFEAIGLDNLTDNVIRHLSHNSGLDFNKRISFEELLEALQKDDTWSHFLGGVGSPSIIEHDRNVSRGRRQSTFILEDSTEQLENEKLVNIKLGPDGSGYVTLDVITEMWESAGISSPKLLLKDLGFNSNVSIDVSELATILQKEIKSLSELRIDHTCNPLIALLQAFITIYQAEIKCLKSILQQVCEEKEKLKFDISEANNRSTLLAQEVDENVLKMELNTENKVKQLESKHSEVLRELSDQFSNEKEQMLLSNQDLEEKIKTLESEELMLRDNLQSVQNYLGVVEGENKELASKVFELEGVKLNLEQQIDELELEKLKVLEVETIRSEELLDEIGVLKRENCELKDQNDEMICQIEELNKEIAMGKIKPKIQSCDEAIYLDGIGLGAKRRNGEVTNEELHFECAITGSPRLGKMRKFHESKEATALDTSFLSVNIESDVDEEDGTLTSSLRNKMSLVDRLLRKYAIKLDCNENSEENYTRMLEQVVDHLLSAMHDEDAVEFRAALTIDPIERTNFIIPRAIGVDDLSIDQKSPTRPMKPTEHNETKPTNDNDQLLQDYKTRITVLEGENKTLQEKCDGLQQGLNLLNEEYEMCEDYWQKKLEEERGIYELEQLQSSEKLNEVVSKLTEYEEQCLEDSKRLTTINETQIEKQYTDLEAEYEEYKVRAQMDLEEQESLNMALKDQLELSLKSQKNYFENTKEVATQVDDLRFMNLAYTKVHFDCYIPPPPQKESEEHEDSGVGGVTWPKINNALGNMGNISAFVPTPTSSIPAVKVDKTVMPLKTKKNRRHVRSLTQPARNLKRCTSSDSSDNNGSYNNESSNKMAAITTRQNEVQILMEQRGHLEKRCMELQSELKSHKRLCEQLRQSCSGYYHSLQHAYTKLDQQFRLGTKLHEKLADNDVLVGNLYIENAYLIKNNQRLEQQLQMFSGHQENF